MAREDSRDYPSPARVDSDQQRGYIVVRDGTGAEVRAGLVNLAVTVVHSSTHNFTDVRQIAELSALAGRVNP